jgi:hypothetical protein
MQGLGRTAMPWYINGEKERQKGQPYLTAGGGALLHYQRVDVRLEEEKDRDGNVLPESPSALIGRKLSAAEVRGLDEITNVRPENLDLLKDLGAAAGERFIREAAPPAVFNPDPWTRIGEAAPAGSRQTAAA